MPQSVQDRLADHLRQKAGFARILDHGGQTWPLRRIVSAATAFLEIRDRHAPTADRDILRAELRRHLADRMRADPPANPLLLVVLLQIVLPIFVRLIVEWWLSHMLTVAPVAETDPRPPLRTFSPTVAPDQPQPTAGKDAAEALGEFPPPDDPQEDTDND